VRTVDKHSAENKMSAGKVTAAKPSVDRKIAVSRHLADKASGRLAGSD